MQMFADDCKVVQSVRPQSVSGTVNGQEVDTAGYDEAMIVLDVGAITATGTLDVKVQETDTSGSGYADVASAAFSQKVTATQNAVYVARLKCDGARKRYIRIVAVQATAAVLAGCSVVLFQKYFTGTAQSLAFDL